MKKKQLILIAAVFLSLIYIIPGFSAEPVTMVISFIPFVAGVLFAIRKNEIIWFIIPGEILVINNHSVLSAVSVQVILVAIFFIYQTPGSLRVSFPFVALSLIITALFGYWAAELQITIYLLLIIALLIAGYLFAEMQWRRIKVKTRDIE